MGIGLASCPATPQLTPPEQHLDGNRCPKRDATGRRIPPLHSNLSRPD
jgi:hypothetical protein